MTRWLPPALQHRLDAWRRKRHRRVGLSVRAEPPTDPDEITERLLALPVSLWSYHFEDPTIRHLGPMAQDFAEAFHLGASDEHINLIDANGVNVVAIQTLHHRLEELRAHVEALQAEVDELTARGAG